MEAEGGTAPVVVSGAREAKTFDGMRGTVRGNRPNGERAAGSHESPPRHGLGPAPAERGTNQPAEVDRRNITPHLMIET